MSVTYWLMFTLDHIDYTRIKLQGKLVTLLPLISRLYQETFLKIRKHKELLGTSVVCIVLMNLGLEKQQSNQQ